MTRHLVRNATIAQLLCVSACFTLGIARQSFGGLTDISWNSAVDNPEGAAVSVRAWLTGGQQDFVLDPTWGPTFTMSPSGFWGFSSFVANETRGTGGAPDHVQINGVLKRIGAVVPGPGEIPFSFEFGSDTPGIFDGPVFFPISPRPSMVGTLVFAARMGIDDDPPGPIYGIGMGVGIVPETSTLLLAAVGFARLLTMRRKRG